MRRRKYAKIVKEVNPTTSSSTAGLLADCRAGDGPGELPVPVHHRREGEISFPRLIRSLQSGDPAPQDIDGVLYRHDGGVFGRQPKWIRKLGPISMPDYSLLDMDSMSDI